MGLGEFLAGVGDVVQTGIQTLPAIIQAGQGQTPSPIPGAPFPGLGGFPGLNLTPPGAIPQVTAAAGVASAGQCAGFRPTQGRMRAVRELRAVNPSTGRIESWTHRGSPLVWSGDRAIAKKYAKAAGFSLRRRGGGGSRPAARRRTTRR